MILYAALLFFSVAVLPAPDSLVAPLWADTTADVLLVIFSPSGANPPIEYQTDWGDGYISDWTGQLQTLIDISRYHRYAQQGTYRIRVRCRDSHGRSSAWGRPLEIIVGEPRLKWVFPTAEPIVASPTIDRDGNIIIGDESGIVYSINPEGQLRWFFPTRGPVYASVVAADSLLYVASCDSTLYCLDLNGRQRWSLPLHDETFSAPAIDAHGNIYVPTDTGYLYAISPQGKLRWKFRTGDEIAGSPTVSADGLIFLTADSIYCLDRSGRRRWTFGSPEGDYFYPSAVVDTNGLIYCGNNDGYLYCIGSDGRLRWRAPSTDNCEIRSEVTFAPDGSLYFGSDGDYLHRLPPGGTPQVIYEAIDIVVATPAVSENGTVYCFPDDGTLVAFAANGRLLMKTEVCSGDKELYYTSSPTISADGTVYVGSWDGGLYAFRGDGPPAKTVWPLYRGNAAHTGRITK
ncbi:MAG: PQQ-binding-like beta-propeller repeat protein [candidate division WOR-3 bacterium]